MKNRTLKLTVCLVFALDIVTKALVVRYLSLHASIPHAPFFSLTHVRNTGAAFGLGQNANWFFIALTAAILALSFVCRRKLLEGGRWAAVGLGLFWGGALGNLLDRVTRGNVVDFLDFYWRHWHWPAFNVADSAICVGAFLLALAGSLTHPTAASQH